MDEYKDSHDGMANQKYESSKKKVQFNSSLIEEQNREIKAAKQHQNDCPITTRRHRCTRRCQCCHG